MQLLFLRQWLPDEVLKALGWTLVHSLWQGLLAAVLAAGIIIATRKAVARLRYNLLGSVLLLFLITVVITFCRELGQAASEQKPIPAISPAPSTIYATSAGSENATVYHNGFIDDFITWFNAHTDLLVLMWGLFFLLNCLKLFTGLASVHRLRHYKTHASSIEWKTKLDHLSKLLGIHRSVLLLQSELVKVPVAIGFFKPVILIPLGLLSHLPPEQVETILLHELAHIRRKDYLVNLLQRFTEAIFFFNPALLWISSLIRQEREACCDDIVVANTVHQRSYLEALVSFQEYSIAGSTYAMGISSRRHYLLHRVKRMITRENKSLSIPERILLAAGISVLMAFSFISKEERMIAGHPFETGLLSQRFVEKENNTQRIAQSPTDTIPKRKAKTRKDDSLPKVSNNKTGIKTVTDKKKDNVEVRDIHIDVHAPGGINNGVKPIDSSGRITHGLSVAQWTYQAEMKNKFIREEEFVRKEKENLQKEILKVKQENARKRQHITLAGKRISEQKERITRSATNNVHLFLKDKKINDNNRAVMRKDSLSQNSKNKSIHIENTREIKMGSKIELKKDGKPELKKEVQLQQQWELKESFEYDPPLFRVTNPVPPKEAVAPAKPKPHKPKTIRI